MLCAHIHAYVPSERGTPLYIHKNVHVITYRKKQLVLLKGRGTVYFLLHEDEVID